MYDPNNLPAYVIVDMEPLINEYLGKYPTVSVIYQYLPLTEMIRLLLVTGMENLSSIDLVTNELGDRLPDDLDVDYDLISFFIEDLALSLDSYIASKFPPYYQTAAYLFYRWVNSTSIMLYSVIHTP